jgi:hypothetical protein
MRLNLSLRPVSKTLALAVIFTVAVVNKTGEEKAGKSEPPRKQAKFLLKVRNA